MKFLPAFILLVVVVGGHAHALTLETNVVEEAEMGKVRCILIRYGPETFSMVPPPAWRAESKEGEESVRLISPDHTLTLQITFSTNRVESMPDSAKLLPQKILPEVADAEVVEEFPAYSGDRHGKGVELSFVVREHRVRCRAAIVPVNGGTVSFVLTGGNVAFDPARQAFGEVLTSFRHQPRLGIAR